MCQYHSSVHKFLCAKRENAIGGVASQFDAFYFLREMAQPATASYCTTCSPARRQNNHLFLKKKEKRILSFCCFGKSNVFSLRCSSGVAFFPRKNTQHKRESIVNRKRKTIFDSTMCICLSAAAYIYVSLCCKLFAMRLLCDARGYKVHGGLLPSKKAT